MEVRGPPIAHSLGKKYWEILKALKFTYGKAPFDPRRKRAREGVLENFGEIEEVEDDMEELENRDSTTWKKKKLCSKSLNMSDLDKLQAEVVLTVRQLEKVSLKLYRAYMGLDSTFNLKARTYKL
ncbi:hypothetical protein CRG98_027169 [Punica granatum]|uniref:Uncharacterized protein n=1 Tax=Punica granatum TaxID=22663 RepID=A0A2I0J875_PUNGR|nr:hypothetical protein CRG98_027169 [Punica granatum]